MFLPKDADGRFPLDPNEPDPTLDELEQAEKDLQRWESARRPWGQPAAGRCPHEDEPCVSRRECIGKMVWWRRYVGQIEAS